MFEVKATAGDTHLGGEDFDNRMVNHFLQVEFVTFTGTINKAKIYYSVDFLYNPLTFMQLYLMKEKKVKVS